MKIKIMFMLAIICFAAATQAQPRQRSQWIDDWKELRNTTAGTLARYNPSAICKLEWAPEPDNVWTEDDIYDACIVAGAHDPSVFWLMISDNPTSSYASSRDFMVQWFKPGEVVWHRHSGEVNLIQLFRFSDHHVVYLGSFETFPRGVDTIRIIDLDTYKPISLTLPPHNP